MKVIKSCSGMPIPTTSVPEIARLLQEAVTAAVRPIAPKPRRADLSPAVYVERTFTDTWTVNSAYKDHALAEQLEAAALVAAEAVDLSELIPPLPTIIKLTPPAFDPGNPKAQANIAKANDAAKRLEAVVSGKAQFLDELVKEHFGGTEHLLWALVKVAERNRESGVATRLELTDVVNEYELLQKEHDAAGQALHDAMAGGR